MLTGDRTSLKFSEPRTGMTDDEEDKAEDFAKQIKPMVEEHTEDK